METYDLYMQKLGEFVQETRRQGRPVREFDVAAADSPVRLLVIPTNEELIIARDTHELTRKRLHCAAH